MTSAPVRALCSLPDLLEGREASSLRLDRLIEASPVSLAVALRRAEAIHSERAYLRRLDEQIAGQA